RQASTPPVVLRAKRKAGKAGWGLGPLAAPSKLAQQPTRGVACKHVKPAKPAWGLGPLAAPSKLIRETRVGLFERCDRGGEGVLRAVEGDPILAPLAARLLEARLRL